MNIALCNVKIRPCSGSDRKPELQSGRRAGGNFPGSCCGSKCPRAEIVGLAVLSFAEISKAAMKRLTAGLQNCVNIFWKSAFISLLQLVYFKNVMTVDTGQNQTNHP